MLKPLKFQLKTPQKWLLGLTGTLLGLVWLARFLYLPVISRIGERRAELRDLKVKIADAPVLTEQLPKAEAALQEAKERYQLLESRIGDGQSVARILEALGQLAKKHRLELVAVQPRADGKAPSVVTIGEELALREVPLSLQLKGRYRQLGEFLGRLPEAPFLASVQQLTMIKPHAESAQLQADLMLTVYLAERMPTP